MLICQLTDLHVRPVGQAANRVSETNALTLRAFRAVAALDPAPDVVLITGDLTECGLAAEYANLAAMLRQTLRMPVYVVPGNHDRREVLRAELAHLPGVSEDPDYVQYAVSCGPVRLVMLDTVVPGAGHGALRPDQLDWLDRTLAAAPDRPTLIGMHHPPFTCGIAHMDRIA
ncbi:MAG: metallophosphoesterase, partial [Rhodospirillales bacterium]|nr:metallophosphoesterase [Rhodospirillales bacterium]